MADDRRMSNTILMQQQLISSCVRDTGQPNNTTTKWDPQGQNKMVLQVFFIGIVVDVVARYTITA